MKGFLKKLFGEYLVWAIGIIGFPVLLWITWVQSVGFVYVELTTFIMLFAITCFLGVIAVRYSRKTQHARLKDLKTMIIGDSVCFILCVIITYTAYMVAYFYMGLCGMGFCLGNIWYYLYWVRSDAKASGDPNGDAKAAGGQNADTKAAAKKP